QLESTSITESSFYRRLSILQGELIPLRAELASNRRQLEAYEEMNDQEGTPVYPETIRDAARQSSVAQQLESQIELQRATLEGLRAESGENYRAVTTAASRLAAFENRYQEVIQIKMKETLQSIVQQYRQAIAAA